MPARVTATSCLIGSSSVSELIEGLNAFARFEAMPAAVRQSLEEQFRRELRGEFDHMRDLFMETYCEHNPDFDAYVEGEWQAWLRDCDEHWANFIGRVMAIN